MSTGDDLLRAIAVDPDDQTLRLVYADWLEETGDDARSEWVRLGVAIAQQGGYDLCDVPLIERRRELLREHGNVWRSVLPAWLAKEALDDPVVPRSVTLTASDFLERGGELSRRLPSVRGVVFCDDAGKWQELVNHAALASIREIRTNAFDAWPALCRSVRATHLEGVHVPEVGLVPRMQWPSLGSIHLGQAGAAALAWLANPKWTPRLQRWEVDATTNDRRVGEKFYRLLARSGIHHVRWEGPIAEFFIPEPWPEPGASELRSFRWDRPRLNSDVETRFFASMRDLKKLHLGYGFGLGSLLMEIYEAKCLPVCEHFSFQSIGTGEYILHHALFSSALLRQCRSLRLNALPEVMRGYQPPFSEASQTAKLEVMRLDRAPVTVEEARVLYDAPGLQNLRRLTLGANAQPEVVSMLRERFAVVVLEEIDHVHG